MVKIEDKNPHCSRKLKDLLHYRSLPEDLIMDIFLRLPVRSLLQLKCVCKSWKTLISDSQFAKRHLQRLTINPSITNLQIFFGSELGRIASLPLKPLLEKPSESTKAVEFSMEQYRFSILGACNGLVCLLDTHQGYVTLWNPSTRFKSKKSPSLNLLFNKWGVTCYGFGYDHVNDKYKVLLDVQFDDVRLYTFGENSWTTIQNFPCDPATPAGKFVRGTLNWVIVRWVDGYSEIQTTILSFDLVKEETYSEILLPQNQKQNTCRCRNQIPQLGVLDNCLCLSFDTETHLVVWLMKEYGIVESWTKLMMIPAEHLSKHVEPQLSVIEALFICGNNIVLLRTSHKFFLYNLNNDMIDIPLISTSIRRSPHLYLETLVSPRL
ncbi:F-box/kelch-repeat protein At3g23880-like [Vicia villosa]|uniref:F-box/kelch-repeat protein At3g23880-like n=1 Tax=Vicia villosa TaxID=3911 RepID=UPI00273B1E03|nr:F-box/kelch-repeat protein At3g23880-like [Vicia villosa]